MDLMLDIINDYLLEHIDPETPIIQQVLGLLRNNKAEHQDIIEYWSVLGEDNPEYYFEVILLIRRG
ncbi:hypothetical protein [Commensalibacter nepenthis]|uniref:Uncharacterized protein n=1 Tax=Commensalibacter nepenthis TaxID=3043872 RepID=A0ABT6Q473_9PROT|nr:hypothetical protein [Commensalibacter sp. TBRC 10068]MDI2111692.1 hypothetical protein [Commensalibacter sp. TBRC 10068]